MSGNIYSKYNRPEMIRSRYYYPDCDVLINRFDIKDDAALTALEEDLTHQRLVELAHNPLKGYLGAAHLMKIHRYIFQDIYPFAGKLREEDISKGNTFFCKCQFIYERLEELLSELKAEAYLVGLGAEAFSERAAYYMGELNMIHPFREGNGRAIREFIRCLALRCGYEVNWSMVDGGELLEASILSADKVYGPLGECIYRTIGNGKIL